MAPVAWLVSLLIPSVVVGPGSEPEIDPNGNFIIGSTVLQKLPDLEIFQNDYRVLLAHEGEVLIGQAIADGCSAAILLKIVRSD